MLCHFCGRWYSGLAHHARLAHSLLAKEYRELAGLNRTTPLVSPGVAAKLRVAFVPLRERLRAEGKLRRFDEDPEKWRICKEKATQSIREGLRPEARRHRSESWDDERRSELAEATRQRNLSGESRPSPEAIGAGVRRYYAEHPEAIDHERLKRMAQKRAGWKGRDVTCVRCGEVFQGRSYRNKYCPACRAAQESEYYTSYARERRRALEDGTWSPRPASGSPREAVCARCGKPFTARTHRERYCGEECSKAACRAQRAEWKRVHSGR